MVPTTVQGSDLCWLLHASAEEGHSMNGAEISKQDKP